MFYHINMFQTNLWTTFFATKQNIYKGPLVALLGNWGYEFEGTTARYSYHNVKINNLKVYCGSWECFENGKDNSHLTWSVKNNVIFGRKPVNSQNSKTRVCLKIIYQLIWRKTNNQLDHDLRRGKLNKDLCFGLWEIGKAGYKFLKL